jgi:hypothetical protein
MSLRSRLGRLERQAGLRDGRCPGCGWRADDLRTLVLTDSRPRPDGSILPLWEVVHDTDAVRDQPGRPRCTVCGGYLPPLAIIEAFDRGGGAASEADA